MPPLPRLLLALNVLLEAPLEDIIDLIAAHPIRAQFVSSRILIAASSFLLPPDNQTPEPDPPPPDTHPHTNLEPS